MNVGLEREFSGQVVEQQPAESDSETEDKVVSPDLPGPENAFAEGLDGVGDLDEHRVTDFSSHQDMVAAHDRDGSVPPTIDQLAREIDADRRDESPAIAGSPRLAATYRHGVTRMVEASSNVPTQDLNLRIDGRLGNRHRLTLAVGSSPHAVEETTYRFATGIAQDPKGAPPTPASVETERETIAEEEVWAGVGYGYSLYEDEKLRIEAGVNLGLGTSANRVGFELPVRVAVTDRIGLEVVGHYTRVMPRNLETSIVEEEEIPLDYLRERRLLDATSLGAQLGISVSLGQ